MQELGNQLAIFIRIFCLRFKGCWWRFGRADWWVVIKLTNDEDYEFLRHLIINRNTCILTKTIKDRSEKKEELELIPLGHRESTDNIVIN